MILFDVKEGSINSISSKCYVKPETKLIGESMAKGSSIEVTCEEKPECPGMGKCLEVFDITTEITYEPVKIF